MARRSEAPGGAGPGPGAADGELFLPNFCALHAVFAVVVMGQLLVLVLVLARLGRGDPWQDLSLLSLLVQWIALGSAAVLCVARRWLAGRGNLTAALVSYLLVLAVAAVVSFLAQRIMPEAGRPALVEFLARSLVIAAIVAAVVLRYLYLQHQWRSRLQAAAQARVDALQARIRPHFLFNALNTIASLIPEDPDTAERLVEDLADLFRASLSQGDRMVALGRELELVEGYLRMEQLRLGDRLRVDWQLAPDVADAQVPPFCLQPLAENAVYYGIGGLVDGGTIRIEARRDGSALLLAVTNPRPAAGRARAGGTGMAQENIRERLALAFPGAAGMQVRAGEREYRVELRLPCRREGEHAAADRR